jgi:hypothetical protein
MGESTAFPPLMRNSHSSSLSHRERVRMRGYKQALWGIPHPRRLTEGERIGVN